MSDIGFLLVADPHFGRTTHDDIDLDGTPSWRQNEARRIVSFVNDEAMRRGACSVVVAGDLFHSVRPQAWAYRAALDLDPDHTIAGNHDWPVGEGVLSPLAMLPGNVYDRPEVREVGGIDVAFLPWFSRAFVAATYPDLLVGEQNRYMAQAIERIVADLVKRKREGVPFVVVTHFTIGGARWNSEVQPQLGESSDFMVPASVFDDERIDHVFSGHIHKPQEFGKVTYIGAPLYSDFGEVKNLARILHVGDVVTEIPTPAVKFMDVNIDRDLCVEDFEGKVVRIVGGAAAGEQTAARIASLTQHILECRALHVAKPAVKFTRHEARATKLIAVDASTDDALTEFAGMVGGEYEAHLPELIEVQHELERKAIA